MNADLSGTEASSFMQPTHKGLSGLAMHAVTTKLSLRTLVATAIFVCAVVWMCIWGYVAFFPMAYQDRSYALAIAKEEMLAKCSQGDIAVFGDSRAVAAIIPNDIDLPIKNLAYLGASPIENYFLIKKLLHCPIAPRLVVIAQSPAMYAGAEYFWTRFAEMGTLSVPEVKQVLADADGMGDDELRNLPRPEGGIPYALLPDLYGVRFPPLYFASLLQGYVFGRLKYNEAARKEVLDTSGHVLIGINARSDDTADEAQQENWNVTPLVNLYMTKTLEMLKNKHIPVAIITMPLNEATCRHLPAVMQPRLTNYLDSVTQKNPDIIMVDSKISCWPDRYFGDKAHFNQQGAEAYSGTFQDTLRKALQSTEMKEASNE